MTVNLFYNKVTNQIADYPTLKSYYPLSWPVNQMAPGVDQVIADTDPPNSFLGTYPTLANWERLYRDDSPAVGYPDGVKLWETAQLLAPELDGGLYVQHYEIVEKNETDMHGLDSNMAQEFKALRDQKLEGASLEYDGFFTDATVDTHNSISRLIRSLESQGDESATIEWKGIDDEYGVPRWKTATVADLQELDVLVHEFQQKAFTAESLSMAQHLNTPFDYIEDAQDFFNTTYDNL